MDCCCCRQPAQYKNNREACNKQTWRGGGGAGRAIPPPSGCNKQCGQRAHRYSFLTHTTTTNRQQRKSNKRSESETGLRGGGGCARYCGVAVVTATGRTHREGETGERGGCATGWPRSLFICNRDDAATPKISHVIGWQMGKEGVGGNLGGRSLHKKARFRDLKGEFTCLDLVSLYYFFCFCVLRQHTDDGRRLT